MRRALVIGSGLALGALCASAHAESDAKRQAELRKTVFAYAKCVVRSHHAAASEAILSTSSNGVILEHYPQIIDADCLTKTTGEGMSMRFPNDTYRNALADALVNADFVAHGDVSFDNRLPLAQASAMTDDEKAKARAKARSTRQRADTEKNIVSHDAQVWLARYGECVVRRDPEDARFWLLTPPETPEETSRIHAMQPAFGECLGAGTVKFNRITMRGAVAINYYRLAMATIVPASGSVH